MWRQLFAQIAPPTVAPWSTQLGQSTWNAPPPGPYNDINPFLYGMSQFEFPGDSGIPAATLPNGGDFNAPISNPSQSQTTDPYPSQLPDLLRPINQPYNSSETMDYSHEAPPLYGPENTAQIASLSLNRPGLDRQSHDFRPLMESNIRGDPIASDSGYGSGISGARTASQPCPPSAPSLSVQGQPRPPGGLDDDLFNPESMGPLDPDIFKDLSQPGWDHSDWSH